jgi:hypothetical protein
MHIVHSSFFNAKEQRGAKAQRRATTLGVKFLNDIRKYI